MKKNVRVISLALAALLLVSACFCITGCKKHEVKMTEKNNGLYDYEEVRQINETLRMPYPLGTREAAFVRSSNPTAAFPTMRRFSVQRIILILRTL